MSEPIVPRDVVARQAEEAARWAAVKTVEPSNPYPTGSDAARAWQAAYVRYSQEIQAPGAEASA